MNSKEQAFIELVDTLDLQTKIKGVLDLCRGTTLFQLFYRIINQEDKADFIKEYALIHQVDQEMQYETLKLRNLQILTSSLQRYARKKQIYLKANVNVEKIAYNNNTSDLQALIKNTFAVLIDQKELIEVITTLSQQTQHELMEIFTQIMGGDASNQKNEDFLTKISELESQIQEKDQSKNDALEKVKGLTKQNEELREQIQNLTRETKQLRKKNQSVEELECLFNRKDADIASLNDKIQQLKLGNMRQKQQYEKQIKDLEKTIQGLKKSLSKYETQSQVQRLKSLIDDKGKALQESNSILVQQRNLLKKVRERCTVLQTKNKDLEDMRLQLSLKIQEKQMQKQTLSMRLQHLQERVRDQEDRNQSMRSSLRSGRKSEVLGLQLNGKFNDDSSMQQCSSVECQQQKEELSIYKNKCLELIKNNEILRGNSTDRSFDKSQQISLRLSNLTAQNIKLKQKVANFPSQTSNQQTQDAINKQKKKFTNLKKKVVEDQQSRNKQAELMMSAMCEMIKIINDNISGPKMVEVLRKLK